MASSQLTLVVTGTGRCGTGYVSKVLERAGVRCGHETAYTPHGERYVPGLEAEASWLAVPYLSGLRKRGVSVGMVYRHPAAVISSLVGIGFFDPDGHPGHKPYADFARLHCPELVDASPFDASCIWYNNWNRRALRDSHFVFNVEYPAWDRMAGALPDSNLTALASAIPKVSQTYNHRPRANVNIEAIPASVWATYEMLEAAARAS